VSVAQPQETSYADDQKCTKAAIDAMGGPVVLVGHSYGGSIITEAGNHPNVAALVYIAAFALDEGESCASIEQAVPQASQAFKLGWPRFHGPSWVSDFDLMYFSSFPGFTAAQSAAQAAEGSG
jgi:pimeloyl-ACP methyl ester carboxylesterase